MIKRIGFRNWKSFEQAEVKLEPLIVLIGTNASGKSNALDGIELLKRLAQGKEFRTALSGEPGLTPIRGGVDWASRSGETSFTLEADVIGEQARTEFLYSITVQTRPTVELLAESLTRRIYRPRTTQNPYVIDLIRTVTAESDDPSVRVRLYNEKGGTVKTFRRSSSILSQLKAIGSRSEIEEGVSRVATVLSNVFLLDTVPGSIRDYSRLSDELFHDASNMAGVLAALDTSEQESALETIKTLVERLPEKEISRVFVELVGHFKTDAMLYCEENWGGTALPVDTRGLSDGTLRVLAILVAILTRPVGSQLIIEEMDNGLHSSRTTMLLHGMLEIASKRNIDLLVTTHNVALMDALTPRYVRYVVAAHRHAESGMSMLTPLNELAGIDKVLSNGALGQSVTHQLLERALFRSTGGKVQQKLWLDQ